MKGSTFSRKKKYAHSTKNKQAEQGSKYIYIYLSIYIGIAIEQKYGNKCPHAEKTDPEEKGGRDRRQGEGERRRGCWSLKFELSRRTLHELKEPGKEREIIQGCQSPAPDGCQSSWKSHKKKSTANIFFINIFIFYFWTDSDKGIQKD